MSRQARFVAAAVATALALAGCGGASADLLVDAARATMAEESARIAITMVLDGGVGAEKQRIDATGVIDFADHTTEMEMFVGDRSVEPTGGGASLIAINSGDELFVRAAGAPAEGLWTRVPDSPDQTGGLDTLDLASQVALLVGGADDLEVLDDAVTVRGTTAVHYAMEVDLERAAAAADDEPGRAAMEQLRGRSTRDVIRFETWVGDQRLLRIVYGFDVPTDLASTSVPGGSVLTAVEYFDFGVPYDPTIPTNVVDAVDVGADPLLAPDGPGEPDEPRQDDRPANDPTSSDTDPDDQDEESSDG